MTTNILIGVLVELVSATIILIGFILAIVFFTMARSQSDVSKKKKLDRRAILFFVGPIIFVVVTRVVWDLAASTNVVNQSSFSNQKMVSVSTTSPIINVITPNPASIGGSVTIKGINFDTIRTENSAMHLYTTLNIKNTAGQTATLFLAQGTSEQINFILPPKVCLDKFISTPGDCRSLNGFMVINPGKYFVELGIDGRGASNPVELSIN